MDLENEEPTCGKGLAAHARLPKITGQLMASVAEILEHHMKALDLTDGHARVEHEAYSELAASHRRIAADLISTGERMTGYRDLPMGRHDVDALTGLPAVEAFSMLVGLEGELIELLERRIRQDREMLVAMKAASGDG